MTARAVLLMLALLTAPVARAQGQTPLQRPDAAGGSVARSFYLVSLDQAPLAEAAEAVLVQSLRSTVTIDPGVEAAVTFRVSEPLSAAELEDRFAATLAEQDIALVRVDGGYRITTMATALAARPRLDIVAAQAPAMKPGALEALTPPVPTEAAGDAPERSSGSWAFWAGGLLGVVALAGLVWLKRSDLLGAIRRRQGADPSGGEATNHQARNAVVDLLLSQQAVDLPILATACDRTAREGRPVEQVLCDLGAVDEAQLAEAYAVVTGLARWNGTTGAMVQAGDLSDLDACIRDRPLKLVDADDWSVMVATADPLDDSVFAALSRASGRMVTLVIALRSEVVGRGEGGEASDIGPLVRPWFRPPARDGAALLQAILSRRLASESAATPQ